MRTPEQARHAIARAATTRARLDADIRLAEKERAVQTVAATEHDTRARHLQDSHEATLHRHEADAAREAAEAAALKVAMLTSERYNVVRDEARLRHELSLAIKREIAADARRC